MKRLPLWLILGALLLVPVWYTRHTPKTSATKQNAEMPSMFDLFSDPEVRRFEEARVLRAKAAQRTLLEGGRRTVAACQETLREIDRQERAGKTARSGEVKTTPAGELSPSPSAGSDSPLSPASRESVAGICRSAEILVSTFEEAERRGTLLEPSKDQVRAVEAWSRTIESVIQEYRSANAPERTSPKPVE